MSDEVEETEEGSEKPKSPLTKNLNTIIVVVVVVVVGFFAYMYLGDKAEQNEQDQAIETRKNDEKEKRTFQENEVKRLAMLEKAAADREAEQRKIQMQADALKAEYEAKKKATREEFNNTRAQAAARKLSQLKNLIQSDLTKFETELLKVDNEITVNNLKISRAASDREANEQRRLREKAKLQESLADLGPEIEKARRDAASAKNQAEYAAKKIEEANLQMREYQKKPQGNQELITKLNAKIESLRKEIATQQASGAKAETFVQSEVSRRQGEINQKIAELNQNPVDIDTPRAISSNKDLHSRREKLIRLTKDKVLELTQLRLDPDYAELAKLGVDVDIQKTIDQMNGLIASLPPKMPPPPAPGATVNTPSTAGTPTAPNVATPANGGSPTVDTGVTVSAKKEKVTIYTLKDGKTVTATKSVDAGDMLSVKTLEGKFQSIFKEDIVKQETREE